MTKHSKKGHKHNYGIYTVGDGNFFAGIVASINALRFYGYTGPIAAIDIGYDDWMRDYLASFEGVQVLDMEPIAQIIRFTDVLSDESPVLKGWAYKAFGITYYDLFKLGFPIWFVVHDWR